MKQSSSKHDHNQEPDLANEKGHENDVRIGALEKDGEQMMKVMEDGGMVAVLSGMEVMYTFIHNQQYQCFIHKFDAEEGRHKSWEMNERNRAMLKNLPSAADQLFEIKFKPGMDFIGVMIAAETGIIRFLDYIGALPAEDMDFMDWQEKEGE
jgi:nickel-dependent lactate racemase